MSFFPVAVGGILAKLGQVSTGGETGPQIFPVNSALLDGTDDWVGFLSTPSALSPEATNFSFIIWVKPTGGNGMLVTTSGTSKVGYFDIFTDNENIVCRVDRDGTNYRKYKTDGTVTQSAWNMVAITFDFSSNTMAIYINGVAQSLSPLGVGVSGTVSSLSITGNYYSIGYRKNTESSALQGELAFASQHNTVLTAGEILTQYNSGTPICITDSPVLLASSVGYWDLSTYTGSRGAVVDGTGNNDLTSFNGITYTGTGLSVECAP